MVWLLIGYMFLFIHRPFEFWTSLGDYHIERIYMLSVLAYWVVYPKKQWLANLQHWSYFGFAAAVGLCWVMSPWMDHGQIVVENWFKILVFYFLIVTVAQDEKSLKHLTWGFLLVMGLYMGHSFLEYLRGRHTYRMGISRLMGIDTSQGDPNSFGASIVFAFPIVAAFWKSRPSFSLKLALILYVLLSVGCILLTGSRSSFLCMLIWAAMMIWKTKYRWRALSLAVISFPIVFFSLPESLQNRFETIINPEVGPENARISGEGRIEGLLNGFELLGQFPLTGVGPGAWRPATGSEIESHNLIGQLLGEMGFLGLIAFGSILVGFWYNLRWMNRQARRYPEIQNEFLIQLARAIGVGILLMFIAGMFGHNLFRHNWLWYGGFLIVARASVQRQLRIASRRTQASAGWRVSYPSPAMA